MNQIVGWFSVFNFAIGQAPATSSLVARAAPGENKAMNLPGIEDIHEFDLRRPSDAFYADPYPTLHALRSAAPLHRCPDGSQSKDQSEQELLVKSAVSS